MKASFAVIVMDVEQWDAYEARVMLPPQRLLIASKIYKVTQARYALHFLGIIKSKCLIPLCQYNIEIMQLGIHGVWNRRTTSLLPKKDL